MTAPAPHIVLVGCGKMGGALLRGWVASGLSARFTVIEPSGLPAGFPGIAHRAAADSTIDGADAVLLAVKPQSFAQACPPLKAHLPPSSLVISIAAGQSLAAITGHFHPGQPVVRAMPNTPAAIGAGITVAVANDSATAAQRALAETLLRAGGDVLWTGDESLMDAVTAVSGSGPAYVFLLIETLARAGEAAGLPAAMAMSLARQTVIGSAALAAHQPAASAAQLRENVTSPGGTTEAALKILTDGRLDSLFSEAIEAATRRGRELNSK